MRLSGESNVYFFQLTRDEILRIIEDAGERPYRLNQILGWAYRRYADSFADMTDLPLRLRSFLSERLRYRKLELLALQEASEPWTKRFLWGHQGKPVAESVLLKYKYGLTGCISSQVGCPVRCAFCASTLLGFERNLTRGEIVEQLVNMCASEKQRIGHVVFMGTGEPFLNYENVLSAIEVICDKEMYGLSRRKVTVSTVGIPEAIRRYARDSKGARLAISLHAVSDSVRSQLIPLNRKHPVSEVMDAIRYYSEFTGQRVTIEYMLLNGINDSKGQAVELSRLLLGLDCLVNLIPWNEVPGLPYRRPPRARIEDFKKVLENAGVKVTVRRSLGADIEAACGQLRRKAVDGFSGPCGGETRGGTGVVLER